MRRRWLFGDQLGPAFLDDPEQPVLMVEAHDVLRRRPFHRQKAHLVLSAMRHRAAELGDRCTYLVTGSYREGLAQVDEPLSVCQPTSWPALRFMNRLAAERDLERLPARGYATPRADFTTWADARGGKRLLMEDFYRDSRRRLDVLMEGAEPLQGRWNFDAENREPPPRTATLDLPEPSWPVEDEIDDEVRADLDRLEREGVRFVGEDGPRMFAASRAEALNALADFVSVRLPTFGRYEDAVLREDRWMSHSMLSAPLNLGLLDPMEEVDAAVEALRSGDAPIASVEGFVRQVIGWRDYIWHLYWYLGEDYRASNELRAEVDVPDWFVDLDPNGTDAACLSWALTSVREVGWAHHIPRLMVLSNYAMQRGWNPQQMTDWFHRSFVDGYDWVMVPNVIGMSEHADGGVLATKPYVGGGNYVNKMTDLCGGCVYDPRQRRGEKACPFTTGYWMFLNRHRDRFAKNFRMAQMVRNLDRLSDLDALVAENPDLA